MSFVVGYGEINPPLLHLGSAATGADEVETRDPGLLPHGQFEINGIRFPIDPQSISIYEENFNHQFQTLRTRESTKVRSGHSRVNIRVSAIFTGVSVNLDGDNTESHSLGTINQSLMPILYSVKKMPLCFIDNELIRRSLPLVNNEVVLREGDVVSNYYTGEVIGAFLQSVNVSTIPGLPHALSADFQFVWYNHRPFANRLEFRKAWVDTVGEQPSRVFMLAELYGQAKKGKLQTPAGATQLTEDHFGRSEFISNFGHPSIAFNATAYYTKTYRIHEARPLLEYLWPYRYRSTNPQVTPDSLLKDLSELPPFKMESFDQEFALQFNLVKQPTVVNTKNGQRNLADIADDLIGGVEVEEAGVRTPANPNISNKFAKQDPRPKYSGLINTAASKYAVDPTLVAAVIAKESGGFARAEGREVTPKDGRPPWRAQGLMQISPDIAKMYGVKDRFDPEQNIDAGTRYLKAQLDRHSGDVTLALWAYFAGPGEQRRQQEQLKKNGRPTNIPNGSGIKYNTAIVQAGQYVDRVMARYRAFGGQVGPTGGEIQSLGNRTIAIDTEKALEILTSQIGPVGPVKDEWTIDELKKILSTRDQDSDERKIGDALVQLIEEGAKLEINEITGKVAEIRNIVLRVPAGNGAIIPDSISVGFGTNLVMVPLQGHRFPTVQYVGGQHTAATISFHCEGMAGRRFVSELKLLQDSHEQAAISFREFVKSSGINVENPLLNGIGINRVMIESVTTDTVPGRPESLAVTIRLIQAAMPSQKQQVLIGKTEVSIDDIALQTFATLIAKGWIEVALEDTTTTIVRPTDSPPQDVDIISTRRAVTDRFLDDTQTSYTLKNKRITLRLSAKGANPLVRSRLASLVDELNDELDNRFRNQVVPKAGLILSPISQYRGFGGKQLLLSEGLQASVPRIFLVAMLGTSQSPGIFHDPKIKLILSIAARKIIGVLGIQGSSATALDKDFSALVGQLGSMLSYTPGHEAYPDLMLPPNPITGLRHDTTPDFFLFNDADVKMSNANLQKMLFNDVSSMPKARGLREGLKALENTLGGIRQVYGVETIASSLDEVVQAAHLGRQGIYMSEGGTHKTVGVTSEGKVRELTRLPPELEGGLLSLPEGDPVILETNIEARQGGWGISGGKEYDNNSRLSYHFQNSPYKQLFETPPSNLHRLAHLFEGDEYKKIFTEFNERYEGNHYAVRRSFPTFKVLFVEEEGEISANTDSPLEAKLFRQYALDDFYGVNSIHEIKIVKNKDLAADVCVISVMDLDGVLYNRKFLPQDSTFGRRSSASLERKNPFLNTIIKEGMKVVVKLGYSNDPDNLDLVFTGQIAQFEGTHLVEIVCQSYGTELVSKRFGTDPSENVNTYNSTTADILHDLMDREEIRHFGRWELKDIELFGGIFGHEKLRPDGQVKKVWTWKPSVVDDNLFVPTLDTYLSTWQRICGDLEYVYLDTTVWDVFKEMELRHPGLIAYPVPYGNDTNARMTMFFGHPSMNYLSRPPGNSTELEGEFSGNNVNSLDMRELIVQLGGGLLSQPSEQVQAAYLRGLTVLNAIPENSLPDLRERLARSGKIGAVQSAFITDGMIENLLIMKPHAKKLLERLNETAAQYKGDASKVPESKFWNATMMFQEGRIRPFRNYELVTSLHDIIDNSIRCDHRDTFNSITLQFTDGGLFSGSDVDFDEASRGVDLGEITVNADDNIKEHHIRRTIETWPNCSTEDLARRYASQLMANSLKRTYRGELVILGKPHLKPYDIIWLYDNYSDMAGPIEIEEVVHSFSSSTGFTTEVVPNMIVVVKEEVTTLMVDAAGAFFTEHLKDFTSGFLFGASTVVAGGLSGVLLKGRGAIAAGSGGARVAGAAGLGESGLLLGTGGAEILTEDDPEGGGSGTAGLLTGIGTGAAFLVNPFVPAIAGIVAGALLYKILKYNATREPVLVTPLIKQGKPFVTGLEGMESDGLLVTDLFDPKKKDAATEVFIKKKWRYFVDGIKDANEILELGWTTWNNR